MAGVTLTVAGTLKVDHGALALDGTTSSVQAADIVVGPQGLVRGEGILGAGTVSVYGSLSPGSAGVTCAGCATPFDVFPSPVLPGKLEFTGPTTLSGARVFVKALSQTLVDSLTFSSGLTFAPPMTTFFADIAPSVTGVIPFVNANGITGAFYAASSRTQPYPWQIGCLAAKCPQPPGVGVPVEGPDGLEVFVNPGTAGSAGAVCLQPGGVSVLVGSCPAGTTCDPSCQRGTCNAVGVCNCPFDPGRTFGWSGTACDAPFCANNCGGAIAGTCTISAPLPSCVCSAPFTGLFCGSIVCNPQCANGGTCMLGAGNAPLCNCVAGWTGSACSTPVPPGQCPPCGAFGTCGANATCVCQPGWSGSACNIPVCPGFVWQACRSTARETGYAHRQRHLCARAAPDGVVPIVARRCVCPARARMAVYAKCRQAPRRASALQGGEEARALWHCAQPPRVVCNLGSLRSL